jgi:4-hydroxy-2-oxoheptanedioate aldolase
MPAPTDRLRRAFAADRPSFGVFCSIASPVVAELLARSGFTFVVIDAQHGGATLESLVTLVQAVELGGATPIVRVPWNDPALVMRVLDLGAGGVIVPMVSTAADAAAAAAACRYPPDGIRSFGIVRGGFGSPANANRDVLCLVMIETVEGLENTEAIVSTPGVDGIFFGPVDLSLSMGLDSAGAFTSPEVAKALATVVDCCRRHGRLAATVVPSAAEAGAAVDLGLRMLAVGADTKYVRAAAERDVAALAELDPGEDA